jgi:hypothetical protein
LILLQRGDAQASQTSGWQPHPPATFFVPAAEWKVLDLLGIVLEPLADFLLEFFLSQRGLQEIWNRAIIKII